VSGEHLRSWSRPSSCLRASCRDIEVSSGYALCERGGGARRLEVLGQVVARGGSVRTRAVAVEPVVATEEVMAPAAELRNEVDAPAAQLGRLS